VPGRVRSAEAGADHHVHALTERPVFSGGPVPAVAPYAHGHRPRRPVAVPHLPRPQRADAQPDLGGEVGGQRRLRAVAPGRPRHHQPDRRLLRRRVQLRLGPGPERAAAEDDRRPARRPGRARLRAEPAAPAHGAREPALPAIVADRHRADHRRVLVQLHRHHHAGQGPRRRGRRRLPRGRRGRPRGPGDPVVPPLLGRAPRHRRPVQGRCHVREPADRDRRRPGPVELHDRRPGAPAHRAAQG